MGTILRSVSAPLQRCAGRPPTSTGLGPGSRLPAMSASKCCWCNTVVQRGLGPFEDRESGALLEFSNLIPSWLMANRSAVRKSSGLPIRQRQRDGGGRLKLLRTLLRRLPTTSERTEHSYSSARCIGSTCGQLILRRQQLTIRIQYISKADRPGPIRVL